jgi:probable phosphoglycerate mutase
MPCRPLARRTLGERGWSRAAIAAISVCVLLSPSWSPDVAAQDRGTLRVYLARHGQTDGNLNKRAQGWTDTPLNETGRRQAALLAERLTGVRLDAIYSSTLSRSRETAQTVASGRGIAVRSLPGLREVGLGRFEDLALDDPLLKTRPRGEERGPDDGESPNLVAARVNAAIAEIRKAHPSGTVLIVGHAGANGYALRALLEMTAQQMGQVGVQDNDELYMIELTDGLKARVFKLIPEGKFNEL